MNRTSTTPKIYCGVDTHADTHHAALVTDTGVILDSRQFDATAIGYHDLEVWMLEHGHPISFGVEGAASYGAGLTRHLLGCGISVVEVPRLNRKLRRNSGKSDPIDAEAAARAVLAGNQLAQPKRGDGPIESIRALRIARSGAVKAATASMNAVRSMIVTEPESLRTELRGHSATKLLDICAAFESDLTALREPAHAIKLSLRSLASRTRELRREAAELKKHLATLVARIAPRTSDVSGLGPDTAAALLITVGDNPDRLRSESSLAHLCGVAPIPRPQGKPPGIGFTEVATDVPTRRCTLLSSCDSDTTTKRVATRNVARQKVSRCPRSSGARSSTLPARYSARSERITRL
ncbi:transposase [Rhodococcus sp. IEGM 1379]|uniref:IS110 family transposase n=1 Tax=Rhodococcus sp. IEGM 1379 TaxID=3047086 RepID=UPI0032D5A5F8